MENLVQLRTELDAADAAQTAAYRAANADGLTAAERVPLDLEYDRAVTRLIAAQDAYNAARRAFANAEAA